MRPELALEQGKGLGCSCSVLQFCLGMKMDQGFRCGQCLWTEMGLELELGQSDMTCHVFSVPLTPALAVCHSVPL